MTKEDTATKCEYCGKNAVYKCSVCGKTLCTQHSNLRTVCSSCVKENCLPFKINKAKSKRERDAVQKFAKRFWGEEEQLAFDRKFAITELPAYVALTDKRVIGFISFAETNDAMIIVALGILPEYQSAGVGRRLVAKIQKEAGKLKKKRLLVATSNDDLPALAFYQSIGFQIYEAKPNVIAEKHGAILKGMGGLPIRDELRLQKVLLE